MNAVLVREILERAGIQFALIGAAAVSLRGHPRFTQDTDFFTTDNRVLDPSTWEELQRKGTTVGIRKGDFDDPLAGVVRVGSIPDQVDVVLGKWKWEQGIISRAERLNAFGGSVLVPTRSDLILLKLAAGGYKDLVDAAALLSLGPQQDVIADVDSHIAELPHSARVEWAKLADPMRQ